MCGIHSESAQDPGLYKGHPCQITWSLLALSLHSGGREGEAALLPSSSLCGHCALSCSLSQPRAPLRLMLGFSLPVFHGPRPWR